MATGDKTNGSILPDFGFDTHFPELPDKDEHVPRYEAAEGAIPITMNLFKQNRQRLSNALKNLVPNALVVLKGGDAINVYNTDVEYTFRQEPFFHWAFGVRHPSYWGAINLKDDSSILFIPRLPEEYAIWMGKILSTQDAKELYGVTRVEYSDEIVKVIEELAPTKILLLSGLNTDSGLLMDPPSLGDNLKIEVDTKVLYPIMAELRVYKSDYELDLLREANRISSEAHKFLMSKMKNMIGCREYQAESIFLHYCYYIGGCRTTAYTCICGSGHNSSVLHYGHAAAPNDKIIEDGDMCLFDMGASYYGYASDITCSFPANGVFTKSQRLIYSAVLQARNKAIDIIKPGVSWVDVHCEATKALFQGLLAASILKGNVDEMIKTELGAIFMPHGLGHLMGLDVHDVGGYTKDTPSRSNRASLKCLRTARVLKERMVLTVEPGCYFIDKLLVQAKNDPTLAKFINWDEIDKYRGFGGVRIEDDILVTESGCDNLTKVPRTIEEIESWMNGDHDSSKISSANNFDCSTIGKEVKQKYTRILGGHCHCSRNIRCGLKQKMISKICADQSALEKANAVLVHGQSHKK